MMSGFQRKGFPEDYCGGILCGNCRFAVETVQQMLRRKASGFGALEIDCGQCGNRELRSGKIVEGKHRNIFRTAQTCVMQSAEKDRTDAVGVEDGDVRAFSATQFFRNLCKESEIVVILSLCAMSSLEIEMPKCF